MEARLFDEGTVPLCATSEWYADRATAPHIDEWVHKGRLELARQFIAGLCDAHPDRELTVADMGCGDGGFLQSLRGLNVKAFGYDLQPTNIEVGKEARGVDVVYGDMWEADLTNIDIVVCTETLEHLIDPHGFVARVRSFDVPYFVASSPWTETETSHYAFHLWAWDKAGYSNLLSDNGYTVTRQEESGMFQVLLGVA